MSELREDILRILFNNISVWNDSEMKDSVEEIVELINTRHEPTQELPEDDYLIQMPIHEQYLHGSYYILRVVGGWIYTDFNNNLTTFVPQPPTSDKVLI